MVRPGFVLGVLLIAGLTGLLAFPITAARSQSSHLPSSTVAEEGPCLAWDISGAWQSQASGGAHGSDQFLQDAAGNVTGTWRNAATGATGEYVQGKITGASVFLRTDSGRDYRGTVDSSGTGISGSFLFDGFHGAWHGTGQASCLLRGASPAPGALVATVDWGSYRFRSSYTPEGSQAATGQFVSLTRETGGNRFSALGRALLDIQAETWNYPGDTRANLAVWDRVTVLHPTDPFERLRTLGSLDPLEQTPSGQRFAGQVSVPPFLGYVTPEVREVHEVYVEAPTGALVSVVTIDMLLIEPLGLVHEAGSASALEGAGVSLLQKEEGQWLPWNAAAAGQSNPQVSGDKGGYGWAIPQGEYLARAFKPCYEDASSAEMKVPPVPAGANIDLQPAACSDLAIDDLWLSDGRGMPQGTFQPGQDIQHHLVLGSTSSADTNVQIAWNVHDPQGQAVIGLSGSATFVVPRSGAHLPLVGRVPAGATEGQYTVAASFTHQGQTSFQATQFRVTLPTWVYLPLIHNDDSGGNWVEIIREDFEGSFPGNWTVIDKNGEEHGEYYWAKSACRAASGTHSGWAIGGGLGGSKVPCGGHYPYGAYSWLKYGPFDLSDATSAEVRFKRWLNTTGEGDSLQYLASVDDNHYQGWKLFGQAQEWRETRFDLRLVPDLGNLTGRSRVWILFVFESRDPNSLPEGVYVDDIVLRKWVPTTAQSRAR